MSRYASVRDDKDALRSGQRDKPVDIEQRPVEDAVDVDGFPSEDANVWTILQASEWMNKESIGGMEQFASNQTSAPVDTVWTMTYRSDMDPDRVDVAKLRRLRYLGRRYDIVSASVVGRNEGIQLVTLSRIG